MRKDISSITFKELFLRTASKISFVRRAAQQKVINMLQETQSTTRLNAIYNNFNYYEKAVFHLLFARLFRDNYEKLKSGFWEINFLNEKIQMPLKSENSWLDWDIASAITGHDIDVKITYETLLKSKFSPRVFFDVGANYGTHSLLFLSQNVETVSFEPNPSCQKIFRELCELNNFSEKMQDVAVSNIAGKVDFWFPEKDTWLGTIVTDNAKNLSETYNLEKTSVSLITIDDYVKKSGVSPDLIKIDTEGNELNVLKGASWVFETAKPFVIFESNQTIDAEKKGEIYNFFEQLSYLIIALPLLSDLKYQIISLDRFQKISEGNFLAIHRESELITNKTISQK